MRAATFICVCSLFSVDAGAQAPVTLEQLAAMRPEERATTLSRVRDATGGLATIHELEMAARLRVDARHDRGLPPRTDGCLSADEFDLDSQLKLARQSADGADFAEALRQYHESTAQLDARLAAARSSNRWWRHFPTLRRWEREWRAAKDARVRELLLRTLNGQAIRAALAHEPAPARPKTRGRRNRGTGAATHTLAGIAYREYVFNLMCANDEENLAWFKRQVAEIGWFGQKKYGWAADQAALLIVQHADADPGFQESVVAALWPRLAADDTDPENLAYLVDRVAVRAGRPQSFGTQMECVNGAWVAPDIQDHATLDDRRRRMNLVAYDVQVARSRGLCRDQ